jgi:reductive dehalogenase
MSNKNITRRDFLKLGGLAAVSLPAVTKVGSIGNDDFLESKEAYGGFLVRTLADDDPPIIVDEERYKRFDATNGIFSRNMWDEPFIEKIQNVEKVYQANEPGYEWQDAALNAGAIFCGTYDGTAASSAMMGKHAGLLSLEPNAMAVSQGASFEGRWDHSHLTPVEVADIVKKAALFYGASLVGIAPMNEKWIYSDYFDPFTGASAPIHFTEVEEVVLPEGQVSPQEAGELIKMKLDTWDGERIKAFLIDVIENADPASLPPGAPPVGMVKVMPASQFKERLSMFTSMPTPMLALFAEKLGLDFEIATIDPGESAKPRYLEDGSLAIPETMKYVIVMAFEMDNDCFEAAPTTLSNAATFDGYSKMAITGGSLAAFIRAFGYNAIPCGNNTGISVPQAIEAGLGEGARNGILITPKYGPRVRLSKVITDLPMATDQPIRFGVTEFCEVCKKCAELCPTQAISYEGKTMEPTTISTNPGVLKWSVNAEECYVGWTANGSGCGQCIRVCPFNKPEGWLHDATRILIGAKSGSLDSIMVKLDDASGYGKQEPTFKFWGSNNFIHIKD